MMFEFQNQSYEVPDKLIKQHAEYFEVLKDPSMREDLDIMRNSVYQILILVEKKPKVLNKKVYHDDFINAMAIKEALNKLKLLHDA